MHGVGNFCWIYVWNNCGDINCSCEKFRLTGNIFYKMMIAKLSLKCYIKPCGVVRDPLDKLRSNYSVMSKERNGLRISA